MPGRTFAPADRFMSEVTGGKLRPAYVFIGDEVFFRDQCRQALLDHLVPSDLRDFSLHDLDLADVSVAEILDRARTPSLMAPFQVFFIRGVKNLFGGGCDLVGRACNVKIVRDLDVEHEREAFPAQ